MTLTDLKEYVRERGIVSLHEMSLHFSSDASAISAMMENWIRKGKVEKIQMDSGSCGGCVMCPKDIKVHYQWIGLEKGDHPIKIVPKSGS
jgi:hypothetical protein